jgi:hypothetical protein
MALDYCTSCQSVEGGFKTVSTKDYYFGGEQEEDQCEQCGELGTKQGIPEHDEIEER